MRKLFWCGAAGMVACAAAFYAVADHAAKYPDSYLGRCVGTAAALGMRANPFVALSPSVASPIVKKFTEQVSSVVGCGALAQAAFGAAHPPCAAKPEADAFAEQEEPAQPVLEPVDDVQPFEPIKVEQMPDEPIKVNEGNWVFDGHAAAGYGALVPETEEPQVGGVEESEGVTEGEIPPMPYAEEEAEGTDICPLNESGCNKWLWKLLEMGGIVREMPDDAEEIPAPTSADDDETQEQGTENPAQDPASETPSSGCQEDPAYHHHYHGCPYMGGCPYPYSRPIPNVLPSEEQEPRQPQSEDGAAKKKKHKKKKPASESGCGKKNWLNLDGCTGQSGVDTMEFRPSDDPREFPGNTPF